jgi:hypothetical protein
MKSGKNREKGEFSGHASAARKKSFDIEGSGEVARLIEKTVNFADIFADTRYLGKTPRRYVNFHNKIIHI